LTIVSTSKTAANRVAGLPFDSPGPENIFSTLQSDLSFQLVSDLAIFHLLPLELGQTLYGRHGESLPKQAIQPCINPTYRLAIYTINQLTPQSRVLKKMIVVQQVKKFPVFYGIRRFARVNHWTLS
jgi:hypothetical protein